MWALHENGLIKLDAAWPHLMIVIIYIKKQHLGIIRNMSIETEIKQSKAEDNLKAYLEQSDPSNDLIELSSF